MSLLFHEFKPSPQLNPYVEFFWSGHFNLYAANLFSQRVVPNGYIELIIHLTDVHCELFYGSGYESSPNYIMVGLFTKPYDVQFKSLVKVFGIRFKPEGIYNIFGVPASEFHGSFADAESLTGRMFREFTAQLREKKNINEMILLSESYLQKNLSSNKTNLYYLNHAAEIIRRCRGLISIEELAGKVYISKRQLEREFKSKLGISPKSYMRIARLNEVNRAITAGKRVDLAELSYSTGYADQAHFIRDFKQFTGESPKVFLNSRENYIINPKSSEDI